MRRKGRPAVRFISLALGVAVLAASAVYVADVIEAGALRQVVEAVLSDPLALAVALMAYAAAFAVRAQARQLTLPDLPRRQAWSALHVALLGNHVLPLRLGEPMRVISVLRRTALPPGPVVGIGLVAAACGIGWSHCLRSAGQSVRLPGRGALAATAAARVLEAAVVWEIARVA